MQAIGLEIQIQFLLAKLEHHQCQRQTRKETQEKLDHRRRVLSWPAPPAWRAGEVSSPASMSSRHPAYPGLIPESPRPPPNPPPAKSRSATDCPPAEPCTPLRRRSPRPN